jgi:head-tail adaptor
MIHGNTRLDIQVKSSTQNSMGIQVKEWTTIQSLFGWLDLQSGDSKYTTYNQKMQESTHIFLADYVTLNARIKAENSRAVIDGHVYDIMLLDDPMGMHLQWEVYLKYTGGQ